MPFLPPNQQCQSTEGMLLGTLCIIFQGFILDVGIQLTLVFWRPAADEEYVLYILSGLWGMSDGVWETQINGMLSVHTQYVIRMISISLVWHSEI